MKILTEKEAEDFLEKRKFKVVNRIHIIKKEQLKEIRLKFPWVMKISSKHIVHKAKIGGTVLNINSLEEAKIAFEKLKELNHFEGILVQEMLQGHELILGIKKTPEFEHVLMFGKGGSNVEKEKDIVFRIFPLEEKDAQDLISETNIAKKEKFSNLQNEKLVKNIMMLNKLIKDNPKILELDINPLILTDTDAFVVDSRVSFE